MTRIAISFCLALLMLMYTSEAVAQTMEKNDLTFAYDVNFDMNFDNREFYKSRFSSSMTIFGARLTPSVGISIRNREGLEHRVMIGIDVMKDFGASPVSTSVAPEESPETKTSQSHRDLFRELTLYYRLDKKSGVNDFSLLTGIFPRSNMEGHYSQAFFSDSLRFYDNNLEGILLKLRRPNAYYELGCDWMGQYGTDRRERFMVFSSGEGCLLDWLSLGYAGYMYHFADSRSVHGVVDNILLNPFARFDFSRMSGLQRLSLKAGWLQGFQHDREGVGHYVFPGGAEAVFEVRNWNVGIRNSLYIGRDMMPYYNSTDAGGFKYGNRLYMGDPFFRVHDDGTAEPGSYDRLEAYYEPVIGTYLKIRLAAIFHFNGMAYSGTQQMVVLRFDLQKLLNRNRQ